MLCLVGLWAVLVLSRLSRWTFMHGDTDVYLALARSLAEGGGYRVAGAFCRAQPPGFPFVLGLVSSRSRVHYVPENLFVVLAALGASLASYWLLSQRYGGRRLLVLALLVAVNPQFVLMANAILSEMPFLLSSALFLAAATRFWRVRARRWLWGLAAAAMLPVAALTRTAGLAFYVGCFVWLARPSLWRRDARRCVLFAALLLAVACPPVVAWRLVCGAHRTAATGSYAETLLSYIQGADPRWSPAVATRAALRQLSAGAQIFFRLATRDGWSHCAALLLPVMLLGLVGRLRKAELVDYCFCAYAAAVLAWPFAHIRFWLPVLPLLVGYLSDGAVTLGLRVGRVRRPLLAVGAGALLAVGIAWGAWMVRRDWRRSPKAVGGVVFAHRNRREAAQFLDGEHGGPVVLASARLLELTAAVHDPRVAVVAFPFGPEDDAAAALAALERAGVTHVAIERKLPRTSRKAPVQQAALRAVEAAPHRFRVAKDARRVQVFELLRPPSRR